MPSIEFSAHEVRALLWHLGDAQVGADLANTETGRLLGRMIDTLSEETLRRHFTSEELRWELDRQCHDDSYALTKVGSRVRKDQLVVMIKETGVGAPESKSPKARRRKNIPDVFERLNGDSVV